MMTNPKAQNIEITISGLSVKIPVDRPLSELIESIAAATVADGSTDFDQSQEAAAEEMGVPTRKKSMAILSALSAVTRLTMRVAALMITRATREAVATLAIWAKTSRMKRRTISSTA